MRKFTSLGLSALVLSLLSTSALAEKIALCDSVKSYQGLHGLCNAYWNETDPAIRQDILEKYEERALEQGAPSMPGLDNCPCWSAEELYLVCSQDLALGGILYLPDILLGSASSSDGFWGYNVFYDVIDGDPAQCSYYHPDYYDDNSELVPAKTVNIPGISQAAAETCLAGIDLWISGELCSQ